MNGEPRPIEKLFVDMLRWMASIDRPVQEHAIVARYGKPDTQRGLKALLRHECIEYDLQLAVDAEGVEHGIPRDEFRLTAKGREKADALTQGGAMP